jgi:hypothetical protein
VTRLDFTDPAAVSQWLAGLRSSFPQRSPSGIGPDMCRSVLGAVTVPLGEPLKSSPATPHSTKCAESFENSSVPSGIRTRVTALKGLGPGPD